MTRLFYSTLALLLFSVSFADAQRSIGRGQSPLTGRGGGSPLGPSGSGSLTTTNSPQAGYYLTTDGTVYYWAIVASTSTNIPTYALTNRHSVDAVFNAGLAVEGSFTNNQTAYFNDSIIQPYGDTAEFGGVYARQFLIATNTFISGRITNSSTSGGGFWTADVSGFVSLTDNNNYILMSQPQGGIFASLDGWILGDALSTRTILSLSTNTSIFPSNVWVQGTNFAKQIKLAGGQTASSILRLDANTNVATVTIGANLTFDGTTLSASGSGGGSASNYSTLNITNVIQRTVWHAGFITNLTIPWGVTNRVVWQPSNTVASVALSGTPGEGTNEQIIHLTAITTNPLMTTITMPTNGIDGLPPFFITGPSTNEFDIIFNGYFIYIVSYQSPATGTGPVLVMQTNATLYTPVTRFIPTVVTGTGGALTNFTWLSTQPEVSINGFTNVSIRAVMGYDAGVVDYWTCVITNGSGSDRTLEFSAVTNSWRFNGVYGTNAPNTLTNNTRLEISGRQHGTNVQVVYGYTPWP